MLKIKCNRFTEYPSKFEYLIVVHVIIILWSQIKMNMDDNMFITGIIFELHGIWNIIHFLFILSTKSTT